MKLPRPRTFFCSLFDTTADRLAVRVVVLLVVAGLLLFVFWPENRFDLQSAINACREGGTVTVPMGTWKVPARINLAKSTNIVGTPGKSILTWVFDGVMLELERPANVMVSGLELRGPGSSSTVATGIQVYGGANLTLEKISVLHSHYGVKVGSGDASTGLRFDSLTLHDCAEPLELANTSDSRFSNLDIQATRFSTNQWHGLYLERSNHKLSFSNVKVAGGSGYCLQLYAALAPSDTITFNNIVLDATSGRYPLVVQGYSNVSFRNLTMDMTATDGPCVRFDSSAANVTFDGFRASGGDSLTRPYSTGPAQGVVFRHGTYLGPTLGTGATFQNVILTSAPPTTPLTTSTAPR